MHATPGYEQMLDYILQFATGITSSPLKDNGAHPSYFSTCGFHTAYVEDLRIGDLIRVQALNDPEWRLCWYEGLSEDSRPGYPEMLVASRSTGNKGKLTNIGYVVFDRETVGIHPEWRWTVNQHAFDARWKNAATEEDAYVYRVTQPKFQPDGSVVVGIRVIHTSSDPLDTIVIKDWKHADSAALLSVYTSLVNQKKAQRK